MCVREERDGAKRSVQVIASEKQRETSRKEWWEGAGVSLVYGLSCSESVGDTVTSNPMEKGRKCTCDSRVG